jgi:hypothetical protein
MRHVGWVELRNPTFCDEESAPTVGFRSSTQPTCTACTCFEKDLLRVLRVSFALFVCRFDLATINLTSEILVSAGRPPTERTEGRVWDSGGNFAENGSLKSTEPVAHINAHGNEVPERMPVEKRGSFQRPHVPQHRDRERNAGSPHDRDRPRHNPARHSPKLKNTEEARMLVK